MTIKITLKTIVSKCRLSYTLSYALCIQRSHLEVKTRIFAMSYEAAKGP